ncbi:alpha/beta fold hydrolase [Herbiconiux sp. YIM B11900]|uniref:alpha/beta fold hydrolase n=1 Tax=Herbiconiux sp. YIM B11900 TaxID=3404131 RepID=UPI003F832310
MRGARMNGLRMRRGGTSTLLNVAVDQGEGPVVVLVHGINSSSKSWAHLVPLLSPLYRVIAIDLLGFGGSVAPATATFTLDEHVSALHATIRSLRLRGRFTLVGHSLGSLIASRYAAVHTREVSQVVLVSPPVYAEEAYLTDRADRLAVKTYLRFYRFLRTDRDRTTRRLAFLDRILPGPGIVIEERYWRAFAQSMEHCIEGQTTLTDVAQIRVGVDVLYGVRDRIVLPDSIERLARLQNVTVHPVAKGEHSVLRPMALQIARVID